MNPRGRRQARQRAATTSAALLLLLTACASNGDAGDTVPGPETTTAGPATTTITGPGTTSTTARDETDDPYLDRRQRMVDDQIERRGVSDPVVLEAMRRVPRHHFVPREHLDDAYGDHPLPIGFGQTISQPFIVALMSEMLGVEPGDRVLEIGTGSGYQAAVLAEMGMDVYTIEIIPELAERAAQQLEALGYTAVTLLTADGYWGWEEHAPFDAIIVTAAPDHVPQPLVGQLKTEARMVIPIGPVGAVQTLWEFTRQDSGEVTARNLGSVLFVPLTRSEG